MVLLICLRNELILLPRTLLVVVELRTAPFLLLREQTFELCIFLLQALYFLVQPRAAITWL
jgi:hypothetical protein